MRRQTIKEKIPAYLHEFIATQDASLYTAIDHASWRYILRVSKSFFQIHAHQKYLDGLRETGISTERIPMISEMDECLQRFGWRAVPIVGFIPPAVFMEFLSLGVLPIACDIRRLEHISYTPVPDIVHEAAGHAPIIADPEYADYLHQYGEVARKVIFSDQDITVYEAVRKLSDLKEDPKTSPEQISQAQRELDEALAKVTYASEATQLSRMGWWTIEYGLVGDTSQPKIYGAGLLSSLSESQNCFKNSVKKIPLTLDCVNMAFDITKPQPQLYVTPDFQHATQVLNELSQTMAYRRGGLEGLEKARKARTVTTAELDSGVQVSGLLTEILLDSKKQPAYLRYQGPCQLSHHDRQLESHGAAHHAQGFGTALGMLKAFGKSPSELTEQELASCGGVLKFESGVEIRGKFNGKIHREGQNLVLSFKDCTVNFGTEVLFKPDWGVFDLACGKRVVSVFGGAADRGKYLESTGGYKQKPSHPKTNRTAETEGLIALYERLRTQRENGNASTPKLKKIFEALERDYPQDWLLRLELLEHKPEFEKPLREGLARIAASHPNTAELIRRGLELV